MSKQNIETHFEQIGNACIYDNPIVKYYPYQRLYNDYDVEQHSLPNLHHSFLYYKQSVILSVELAIVYDAFSE